MRALSLWQPWAGAVSVGIKRVETRSWSTSYRGPIAIHAAKSWGREQREAALRLVSDVEGFNGLGGAGAVAVAAWVQSAEAWPRGGIVAVASLVDCVPTERLAPTAREARWGDFTPGRFGWVLSAVQPLVRTYPLVGRQGLWTLSQEEEACVRAALPGGSPAITKAQREKLEHALGLDYPHKIKDGVTYRRHFCATDGDQDMEALVACGLMERGGRINEGRDRYYLATEAGQRAVGIREVTR